MNSDRLKLVHNHSIKNRQEILRSEKCRCFQCLYSFKPEQIKEWVDNNQTALCPNCFIDSVIGSASGFSSDDDGLFLDMQYYWFMGI